MEELHYHDQEGDLSTHLQESTRSVDTPSFVRYAESLYHHEAPHDALLDTYGLHLDGLLERIHACESYFEEFPGIEAIEVPVDPPMHGNEENAENPTFVIDRATVGIMKEMALWRYEDLTELSGLGHELARDIVKSWDGFTMHWDSVWSEIHEEMPEYQKDIDQSG